jgi:chemotaxis protein MotB
LDLGFSQGRIMAGGSAAAGARGRGRGKGGGDDDKVDASEVRWLISYSDYMMQLVVLFILLYSVSAVETGKLKEIAEETRKFLGVKPRGRHHAVMDRPPERFAQMPVSQSLDELLRQLKHFGGKDAVPDVAAVPLYEGIKITVRSAQFDEGSAEPPASMDRVIDQVAQFLVSHPASRVEVRGHTSVSPGDTAGGDPWLLSFRRAKAVAEKLQGDRTNPRVMPARFRVTGCSFNEPMAGTGAETPEGRAADRRVEIIVSEERVDIR